MPIQWAIISGETYTGITAHFINDKIDLGKIIIKKKIKISLKDTAFTLANKIKKKIPFLILTVLKLLNSKNYKKIRLKKIKKTDYFKRRSEKIDRINTNMPLEKIYNFIRGLNSGYPFAWIFVDKKKVFVKNSMFVKPIKKEKYKEGINIINKKIIIKKNKKYLEFKNLYIINKGIKIKYQISN